MRLLFVVLLGVTSLCASFEYKGKVETFYQQNIQQKSNKDAYISDMRTGFDVTYFNSSKDFKAVVSAEALYDPNDSKRRYIYVTQVALSYNAQNYTIEAGELIANWSKLEGFSPMDIYNVSNILKDPLEKSRLGTLGALYTYYFENSNIQIAARFLETMQEVPYSRSIYYIFDDTTRFKTLENSLNLFRPTLFIRYNATLEEDDYSMDYGFLVSNGFDPLRGVRYVGLDAATNGTSYQPTLFYSSKLMGYVSLPLDAWVLKSEVGVTYSEDARIAHYAQTSFAVEYSTQGWEESNLIYLAEYHRFIQSRTTNTLSDRDFFYLFQNDLLLGTRLGLNDVYNSSIQVGAILDFDYLEMSLQVQYSSKFSDELGFTLKALQVIPTQKNYINSLNTLYRSVGTLTSISFLLNYTF